MLTAIAIIINDTGTGHLSRFYFNILELYLKTFLHSGQLIWEVFVLCKADCRLFSCRKFLTFSSPLIGYIPIGKTLYITKKHIRFHLENTEPKVTSR